MAQTPWSSELEFALAATRHAGDQTLPAFYQRAHQPDQKPDGSIVTKTDLATEQWLRDHIAHHYPDDGFLGEEFGETTGTSGRRWIADPIDGTFSFAQGVPLYGTLLALETDGISRVGVIHMPALGETVYAAQGLGAWHLPSNTTSPVPARFRACTEITNALACATSPDYFDTPELQATLHKLLDAFGDTRGWSDCYAHVLAATGRVDVVIEPLVHPWDIAPMTVIHREAGGLCTDWSGTQTAHQGVCLVTAGTIHDAVLKLLKPAS